MANYPSINRKWQSHLLFISNFIFGMKHCIPINLKTLFSQGRYLVTLFIQLPFYVG